MSIFVILRWIFILFNSIHTHLHQILDDGFNLKYTIPIKDVTRISASSQTDNMFVLHVDRQEKDKSRKGDNMFMSDALIEIVTRVFIAYRKITSNELPITISDTFMITIDSKGSTQLTFDRASAEEVS